MGQPELDWDKVPLAKNIPTLELPIDGAPSATGMGNPHCTFFVEDAEKINLEEMGPKLKTIPYFQSEQMCNLLLSHPQIELECAFGSEGLA